MTHLHRVYVTADRTQERLALEHFAATWRSATKGMFLGLDLHEAHLDEAPDATLLQRVRDRALYDSTVTVVLIGRRTWAQRRVDLEIRSSLRQTAAHARNGLLGILLPAYEPRPDRNTVRLASEPDRGTFGHNNIPECLWQNVATGYASIRPYPRHAQELTEWIRTAYLRRFGVAWADESGAPMRRDHPRDARNWAEAACPVPVRLP